MPVQATTLVKATGTLTATADADIVADETVVIAGKTYTFKATPAADGDVKHVTGFAANILALQKAIGLTGIAGTDYDTAMTANLDVVAVLTSSGVTTFTARTSGTVGNQIPITVGTSATAVSGAKLTGGLGSIDTAINELQAAAQLNSDVLAFLAFMEA